MTNGNTSIEVPALGNKSAKNIWLSTAPHEGTIKLYADGTHLRPALIKDLINELTSIYETFIRWECPSCDGENHTTEAIPYGYKWVRCQHCKTKTKREDLGLDNS